MPKVRLIDAIELVRYLCGACPSHQNGECIDKMCWKYGDRARIENAPTIEAEPVRHGRWIECDYKHIEHGMIETEPKAGLCCSDCRTAFQKKKMTYKQYCAACGARMYAEDINVLTKYGGADNG